MYQEKVIMKTVKEGISTNSNCIKEFVSWQFNHILGLQIYFKKLPKLMQLVPNTKIGPKRRSEKALEREDRQEKMVKEK